MNRIVTFSEAVQTDVVSQYEQEMRDPGVSIIIDNGSYQCRAGWSIDSDPRLILKNVAAKIRNKKTQETEYIVGSGIQNIEAVRWQLKSAFERNVVTQFDVQESVLNHMFGRLSIDTDQCVNHGVVMTEPVLNPAYCRETLSTSSPSQSTVSQCDTLPPGDYIIISCGYQTIHIIPILNGTVISSKIRRINFGGASVDWFMLRTLQLKYPGHMNSVTLPSAEELVHRYCRVGREFESELYKWMDDEYYNNNVIKVQLPYTQVAAAVVSAEQLKDRREQQLHRLQAINMKRRQEKLAVEESNLMRLQSAQQLIQEETENDDDDDEYDDEFKTRILMEHGMSSVEELNKVVENLIKTVDQLRDKIQNTSNNQTVVAEPDNKDPDKRGRPNKQSEPANKKQKIDPKKQDFGVVPNENDSVAMKNWIENLQQKKQKLLSNQSHRRQRRADMTKRRTAASHDRMRILTQLSQGNSKKEDSFGMNDDDWNVYKYISRDGGETDSEDELDQLELINYYLNNYDPASKTEEEKQAEKKSREVDIAEYYRLHVALEQIRIPELLFQPSMLGLDQGGVAEALQFVINKFCPEEQDRLVQHVFVTGGSAQFPGLVERLEDELRSIRPFQSTFNITRASHPALDAWRGARAFSGSLASLGVSRAEYEEHGGSFIKQHSASNQPSAR